MKKTNIFQQYIWIVSTIQRAGRISLKDLNQKWVRSELSEGLEMTRNTFKRHIDAIQDIFGIIIECDKRNGFKYHIENAEVLREDSIQNWMLSSIAVQTAVQESVGLQKQILLEEIPSGQGFLLPLLEAMKANKRIAFTYQKYSEDNIKHYTSAEPYCLKLYKQRWYLLTRIAQEFRIFSLDRIQSLDILQETFKQDRHFDAKTFFHDWYGVYKEDNMKPEKVVIRAFEKDRYYLRDLPIHHSQQEIRTCQDYSDFSYFLYITNDFIGEILRRSTYIKVLEPQHLQKKLSNWLRKMLNYYE